MRALRRIQSPRLIVAYLILQGLIWQGFIVSAQDRVQPGNVPAPRQVTPATAADSAAETPTTIATSPSTHVSIGDGDLLQVSLYGVPDFNQQARVSGAGEITLPMIGNVQVRGLSTDQAEVLVGKRLKEGGFFNDPQVSVLNREFATQGITVLGEVQKPGIYPIMGPRKLFDVISAAGGTAPHAGRTIAISHRMDPQVVQTVALSDDPKRTMDANVDVFPGDTVVISKAGIVYVVGDVRLPGGFVMDKDKDLTVLQALALAQGAGNFASLNLAKIIRKTPAGPVETAVDLKAIMAGKAEDIRVRADDILFVPHNGRKEATRMALQTIIQTASGIMIYRF